MEPVKADRQINQEQSEGLKIEVKKTTVSDALATLCLGLGVWLSIYGAATLGSTPNSSEGLLKGAYWPTLVFLGTGAVVGLVAIRRVAGVGDSPFVIRLGLYVTVAAITVYVGLYPNYGFLRGVVVLGLAASAYCYLCRLLAGRARGAIGRGLDTVAFNLCLLFLAGEALLAIYGHLRPSVLVNRSDADAVRKIEQSRLKPDSLWLGSRINAGGHNDRPFVDPSQRQGRMVLNIGDSFSVGKVPHYYHYTTVAERALNGVEIYNMGVSAIGPREYLHLFQTEGLPLKPDLVVVAFFIGNDFGPNQPQSTDLRLGQRFLDRKNLLMYLVPSRLYLMYTDARDKATQGSPEASSASALAGELTDLAQIHQTFPWLDDPMVEPPTFSQKQLWRIETEAAERNSTLPKHEFERRLERYLPAIREAAEVPVLVVLIPSRYQVEDDLWQQVQRRSKQQLKRDRPQRIVGQWLAKNGFSTLNLLPIFRAAPPLADGKRHLYSAGDTHTNRRGNEIKGRELAKLIEDYLPGES